MVYGEATPYVIEVNAFALAPKFEPCKVMTCDAAIAPSVAPVAAAEDRIAGVANVMTGATTPVNVAPEADDTSAPTVTIKRIGPETSVPRLHVNVPVEPMSVGDAHVEPVPAGPYVTESVPGCAKLVDAIVTAVTVFATPDDGVTELTTGTEAATAVYVFAVVAVVEE